MSRCHSSPDSRQWRAAAGPGHGVTGPLALPPVSPAARPTCAYDHGDEGLGQRGADSLPSPQPRQDPGHGAELRTGHPPQPFAHQQVKPEGWGAVAWPALDLCPGCVSCVSLSARTLESASLIACLRRGGDSAQGCGLALGGGNTSACFKSCKSTDQPSFLPRILNKTVPAKKGTWVRLLLRSLRTVLTKVRWWDRLSLALRKLILALV